MTIFGRLAYLLVLGLALASNAFGQADSVAIVQVDTTVHSPRGALWRAAVLPGWGQYYNRHYLKIPIVYAGFAGITYGAVFANNRYLLYRHAYQFRAYEESLKPGEENPAARYESDYNRLKEQYGRDLQSGALRSARDSFRRNRDLSYFGLGLFYGLTILDAYVNAHLFDFDIDEQLGAGLRPGLDGPAVAVRYTF